MSITATTPALKIRADLDRTATGMEWRWRGNPVARREALNCHSATSRRRVKESLRRSEVWSIGVATRDIAALPLVAGAPDGMTMNRFAGAASSNVSGKAETRSGALRNHSREPVVGGEAEAPGAELAVRFLVVPFDDRELVEDVGEVVAGRP